MKELSDTDFDQIFKNKIKEGYPEYEEGSWLKMEEKLRKRDRFVFFRNASIILLFLSAGIGLYVISGETIMSKRSQTAMTIAHDRFITDKNKLYTDEKLVISEVKTATAVKELTGKKIADLQKNQQNLVESDAKIAFELSKTERSTISSSKDNSFIIKQEFVPKSTVAIANRNIEIDSTTRIVQNQVVSPNAQTAVAQEQKNATINEVLSNEKPNAPGKTNSKKAKLPVTLSINVGPDFNSTETAIGGKGSMAIGVGVSIGLSQKLSLQTGVNYGSKNYKAKGYDYTFNNPNTVNIISGIDAACKVIEVPLRASYTIMNNQKNSIDLNAGLSSYFMLKENYRFMYTTASGRKDRFLEKENSNQHYLSVIDLSATYNVKLKNKKFALGVQPYVKIPITGIGEGSVPLKSSGISLKLNYELNKKK